MQRPCNLSAGHSSTAALRHRCLLSFRRLPERPEKPHKQLTATQRAADAALAGDGGVQKRRWLPWRRNKAATAAASQLVKVPSNKGSNGAVTVVRVEGAELQHLNGSGSTTP